MLKRSLHESLNEELDPARRLYLIDQALCPPEPQLLDTSVLQNLDWIDRQREGAGTVTWDDAAIADLARKYGSDLADDLIDLGTLYTQFEYRGGYPWLVCNTVEGEVGSFDGAKAERLKDAFQFFRGHQKEWSDDAYPEIAKGMLLASGPPRVHPLVLRGLGVNSLEEVYAMEGPLSFLADRGDREIAGHALLANIPAVVTTDRHTFWRYRRLLKEFGLHVIRPTELLKLYLPYWDALDAEFRRRGRISISSN